MEKQYILFTQQPKEEIKCFENIIDFINWANKEEEKNIFTTDSSFITLVEFKSKESVFYTKSIKDILSNLFLEIILENDKKELKLDFVKSFSNNYIFPSVSEQIEKNIELKYNQEIEGKIKKNFKKGGKGV